MAATEFEESIETELKLEPREPSLLDRIWTMNAIGHWSIQYRRTEHQRSEYFDTTEDALGQAHATLRWRLTYNRPIGELTLKRPHSHENGVVRRRELTALLPRHANPLTFSPVPEPLSIARSYTTDPLQPVLLLLNERRLMLLERNDRRVEAALDLVRIPNTDFVSAELELELVVGQPSDLHELHRAIGALGPFSLMRQGKRSRAREYQAGQIAQG